LNVLVKLFYIVTAYKLKEVHFRTKEKSVRPSLASKKNKSHFNFEKSKQDNLISTFFFAFLVDEKNEEKK